MSENDKRRALNFLWIAMPALGAFSLWMYRVGGGGEDKFRNALVLACLGLMVLVVEEARYWLRRRRNGHG